MCYVMRKQATGIEKKKLIQTWLIENIILILWSTSKHTHHSTDCVKYEVYIYIYVYIFTKSIEITEQEACIRWKK